ncbi:MAG TPA: YitT family protein [Pirellulaceae bacterium]|nr:YitT family protein [Pirellulaceae bacterium]
MAKLTIPRWFIEYAMVVFAGILYAIALKYFVLPSKVILTGSEGIAAALSYFFDSYWLFVILYVVFQAALLTFGFATVSRVFAIRSLIVVLTVVAMLAVLPELRFAQPEPQHERIILVIFGGLLAGVAKAVAFRYRGSTGDEDVLGAYFAMKYLKPVGSIAVVAAIVSTAFGLGMDYFKHGQIESVVNTLMYTCIYIFASVETLNNLYHKFQITMLAIVTRDHQAVGAAIKATSSHRTYTIQEGEGGHSGEKFRLVQTIITYEELPQLIEAVEQADPKCFYYSYDLEGISRGYYISPIG